MDTPSIRNVSKALPTATNKQKDPFLIQRASPPRGWWLVYTSSAVSAPVQQVSSYSLSHVLLSHKEEREARRALSQENKGHPRPQLMCLLVSHRLECAPEGRALVGHQPDNYSCPRGQRIDVEAKEEKEEEREREEGEDRRSGKKDGGKEGRREGGRKGSLDLN